MLGLLTRAERDRIRRRILKYYIKSLRFPFRTPAAPATEEGRSRLAYWFELRDFVDQQINAECSAYYEKKHPKHYMWTAHNQYIFDEIGEGERVLDIGCGSSYYQQWIAEKAAEVVAVDLQPERVELSRKLNTKPNLKFEVMDVTRELPEGRFDVVVCSHVIEHLDDPVILLRALAQRIPRLIVKVPLIDSHWMKLVRKDIGIEWRDTEDHRREYTPELLREQLEASGWQPVEIIRGWDLRGKAVSTLMGD